jgi:hypothetical protein
MLRGDAFHGLSATELIAWPSAVDLERGMALNEDLDFAFDLSHLVYLEFFDRRAVDHGSTYDVEPGSVALA